MVSRMENVYTYVSVTLGVDEHDIVAAVVVSTVDKHRVEEIRGWVVFVRFLQELIQVQFAVKLKPATDNHNSGLWSKTNNIQISNYSCLV